MEDKTDLSTGDTKIWKLLWVMTLMGLDVWKLQEQLNKEQYRHWHLHKKSVEALRVFFFYKTVWENEKRNLIIFNPLLGLSDHSQDSILKTRTWSTMVLIAVMIKMLWMQSSTVKLLMMIVTKQLHQCNWRQQCRRQQGRKFVRHQRQNVVREWRWITDNFYDWDNT